MSGTLLNVVRRDVQRAIESRATTRVGQITMVDPVNWTARVMLLPEEIETGWIPVGSLAVGNGWGIHAMPLPGDQVEVNFREGDYDSGLIGLRFFSTKNRPKDGVGAEDFAIIHKGGASLKFAADGTVTLTAQEKIKVHTENEVAFYCKLGFAVQTEKRVSLFAGEGIDLRCGDGISLYGPVTIEGPLETGPITVNGGINATGAIVGGG